jgi:hypothetical protein
MIAVIGAFRLYTKAPTIQILTFLHHKVKCIKYLYLGKSLCAGGPGSVVGIATAYGLDGLGIESRWGRDFPHLSRLALRPTQPPIKWVPDLSRGEVAAGA